MSISWTYIMGCRHAELEAAAASIGSSITATQADVAKRAGLERVYA